MIETIGNICEYFSVERKDLLSRRKDKQTALARIFAYYILHINKGYSVAKVANVLGRSKRNIQIQIACLKHNIQHNKEYKGIYEELVKFIHII